MEILECKEKKIMNENQNEILYYLFDKQKNKIRNKSVKYIKHL